MKKQIKTARERAAFRSLCVWEKIQQYLSKLKTYLLFDSEIPILVFFFPLQIYLYMWVKMYVHGY